MKVNACNCNDLLIWFIILTLFIPSTSFFDLGFPSVPTNFGLWRLELCPSYPFLLLKNMSQVEHRYNDTLWTYFIDNIVLYIAVLVGIHYLLHFNLFLLHRNYLIFMSIPMSSGRYSFFANPACHASILVKRIIKWWLK